MDEVRFGKEPRAQVEGIRRVHMRVIGLYKRTMGGALEDRGEMSRRRSGDRGKEKVVKVLDVHGKIERDNFDLLHKVNGFTNAIS